MANESQPPDIFEDYQPRGPNQKRLTEMLVKYHITPGPNYWNADPDELQAQFDYLRDAAIMGLLKPLEGL